METFLVFAGFITLVAAVAGLMIWKERKRARAIETHFTSRGDKVWIKPPPEVQDAALEAVGHPPELKDGPSGVKWAAEVKSAKRLVWAVEHSYSRGSGKSRRTYTHTLASTQVPRTWATTTIARANVWNKLSELMGKKDMQLDNSAFNKVFHVTTDDENFALVFLTPQLQEWMLATPKDWSFRVSHGTLHVLSPHASRPETLTPLCDAPAHILTLTTPELLTA
jgi:Protein of unknown function (DUF3137)